MAQRTKKLLCARSPSAPSRTQMKRKKTYALYIKTKKTIPRDGGVDLQGARKVAESWKDFGLQKTPLPVDGAIDLSYLAEARK